ncbi:hypothetical protein RR46_06786 [Papilio xuthus]|uniref:Uncharacterized protein n=1 Tax=Papilio xuthus TaxID=66420 RepID=A0A194PRW5_PAPXU|nr:hypothetical protein RR46_06786 [Papilio xuthus]
MSAAVAKADGWCAVVAGCAALVALGTLATPSSVSDTSEELRQALVLVDILRSGMARRRTTGSLVAPATAALPGDGAPWPGPYYSYGENNAFTSASATSKVPEEQSSPINWTETSEPLATESAGVAVSAGASAATAVPTAVSAAHAMANIITTSPRALQNSVPQSTSPAATTAHGIQKLNYSKEDRFRWKLPNEEIKKVRQSEEHIEMSQAAEELQREATAGGQRGGGAAPPWRPRGTTRVHLARSSALPRPLPENNAFCHASPRSPLCRTFI